VRADRIDAVAADGIFTFNDQISRIPFEPLNKAAVACGVITEPAAKRYRVTELILGTRAPTASGCTWGG